MLPSLPSKRRRLLDRCYAFRFGGQAAAIYSWNAMIKESESAKMSCNVIDVHPCVSTFVSMGVPKSCIMWIYLDDVGMSHDAL